MKSCRYFTLLLLLLVGLDALGQDASFTATVSKNPVGLNETFQVTFTLENANGGNFRPPSFSDFNVLGGPNQSTSMSYVNGSMSQTIAFSYYLQPKNLGKFTIGSATITAGGKVYNSNKIPLEVVKGSAPAQSNNSQNGGGGNTNANLQAQLKDNLFVKATVDRSEVYVGEQVTVTYKLYSKVQIGNTNLTNDPSFTGFWKQDIESPQALNLQPEVYNGTRYNSAIIKKEALFPQHSGDLEIDPMGLTSVVRVQVNRQSRSFFDDFFGNYQDVKYDYESNKLKIKVKPLPTVNKPLDFSGFVGSLGMEVVLDKKETKTDDPITISVRFNGTGNLKALEAPKIELPNDFDIFDPKLTEKPKSSTTIGGSRTYDYLVIPRRPGTFKLPPITLSYFDPTSEKYKTLTSGEFTITVTGQPSKSSSTGGITGVSKEDVQLLGQDIRYIKTDSGGLHKPQGNFFGSWAFAGLYGAPFLLFIGLLAYRRREEKLNSDTALVRKRGATKAAIKRLKTAKTKLDSNDSKGFYDELAKGMWGYLGDKLGIDPSALNHETAKAAMVERNVPMDLLGKTFRIISDCEMALYAPSAVSGTMGSMYEEARELIDQLEEALGK